MGFHLEEEVGFLVECLLSDKSKQNIQLALKRCAFVRYIETSEIIECPHHERRRRRAA